MADVIPTAKEKRFITKDGFRVKIMWPHKSFLGENIKYMGEVVSPFKDQRHLNHTLYCETRSDLFKELRLKIAEMRDPRIKTVRERITGQDPAIGFEIDNIIREMTFHKMVSDSPLRGFVNVQWRKNGGKE